MNQQNKNNNLKIYTLSVPPTPEAPYLYSTRHRAIINYFEQEGDTYFTTNSQGEVDFYVLIKPEDSFEDFADVCEEFELCVEKKEEVELRIDYEQEVIYTFRFDLVNPLHRHILNWLVKEERINIYYIKCFTGEYICTGLKTSALPKGLIYDLARFLTGKRSLLLPAFSEHLLSDSEITKTRLLGKAWGFYLDYTALLKRIGNVQDTEEIVSRYIFDIMARLQRSRCSQIQEDELILWVGRKVGVMEKDQPAEYYNIYLSGNLVKNTQQNPVKLIAEKSLRELPELRQILWISPLAEEGIPLVAISAHSLYRFNLTSNFFSLSDQLFKKYYLPHHDYINCYHKIERKRKLLAAETKIYSLVKKRKEKGIALGEDLTADEVMNLVEWGNEEDLPVIFQNINSLKGKFLDETVYILSQRYKLLLEPFLFSLLETSSKEIKEAAMLGLGLIGSREGILFLVEKLSGCAEEAATAVDALLIMGEPVVPYLVPLLKNKKANVRLRAVKVLGYIGSEQALEALKNMGVDQSIRVENAKKTFFEN